MGRVYAYRLQRDSLKLMIQQHQVRRDTFLRLQQVRFVVDSSPEVKLLKSQIAFIREKASSRLSLGLHRIQIIDYFDKMRELVVPKMWSQHDRWEVNKDPQVPNPRTDMQHLLRDYALHEAVMHAVAWDCVALTPEHRELCQHAYMLLAAFVLKSM